MERLFLEQCGAGHGVQMATVRVQGVVVSLLWYYHYRCSMASTVLLLVYLAGVACVQEPWFRRYEYRRWFVGALFAVYHILELTRPGDFGHAICFFQLVFAFCTWVIDQCEMYAIIQHTQSTVCVRAQQFAYTAYADDPENVCIICLHHQCSGDKMYAFPWRHIVHRTCFLRWNKPRCPACTRPLPTNIPYSLGEWTLAVHVVLTVVEMCYAWPLQEHPLVFVAVRSALATFLLITWLGLCFVARETVKIKLMQ